MTVMTKENAKLGAEVGSIFVQFADVKDAYSAVKKTAGRIYNALEIKCTFIEEPMYMYNFKL